MPLQRWGPRLVYLVRRAALLLVVNCTFSFAWVSSPTPHTSGEASPRHASPAIGGRRLVDLVRRAADNLAVFLCLFFAWPRSSFRPLPLSPPSSLPADDLTRDGDVERNPGPAGRPPRARLFASSAPVGDPAHPFRCPFSSCSALGWATKAPLLAHLNGTHHKCGQFSDACFLAQMSWSQCSQCNLVSSGVSHCFHCGSGTLGGGVPSMDLGAPLASPQPNPLPCRDLARGHSAVRLAGSEAHPQRCAWSVCGRLGVLPPRRDVACLLGLLGGSVAPAVCATVAAFFPGRKRAAEHVGRRGAKPL